MPLQVSTAVENNFRNGLITEATGLNFPENACTETYNCVFNYDGSVTRRTGIDFEGDFQTKSIDRTGCVVSSYLWKNISGSGDLSLVVLQVGSTLYFYEISNNSAVSAGAVSSTVTLTPVSGAPSPATQEAQFASGNGKLFVTHPYCQPLYVTYNASTQTATGTAITIKIRDFEGDTADTNAVDTRPTGTRTGISVAHLYNLYNQGWNLTNLNTWDGAFTTMPSNADVMWAFKNSSDAFATATVPNVVNGNSPAPKGHYILPLASTNRNTQVSADDGTTITTVTESNTSTFRPGTCAFFAGRVFYSGIQYTGYESKIYFSQIIERDEQYGFCYQKNDPTAEDSFDLLPDDGGVISIPDAGQIIKLFTVIGGMVVFAQRGVWFITGSTGIGFTATDYTVQRVSSIGTLSPTSFVDINGFPAWWTTEGIYLLTSDQASGSPSIRSLTFDKINKFYELIPVTAKRTARGTFNYITSEVQWIYNTNSSVDPTGDYEYNRALTLNMRTGAFYPWTITPSTATVNNIILLDGTTGSLTSLDVIDDSANTVIDDSSNNVVAFQATNSGTIPQIAYVVSFPDSGTYRFTFASSRNTNYLDWFSVDDVGLNYDSYFISGYKLRGQGIKKWQNNWLRVFTNSSETESTSTSYTIRGLWDYGTDATTNRWSTPQTITHNDIQDYATVSKRIKIRGHGLALQFKVDSVPGENFNIIGWTELDTANQMP